MIKKEKLDYFDDQHCLEAFIAYDTSTANKKPAVLIMHAAAGRDAFVDQIAERIAQLGYVGIALDMYGKGIICTTREEKMKYYLPLVENRQLLLKRMLCGYELAKKLPQVDTTKIAIIGYCFGGMCAVDLARSGASIRAAVSFHGMLKPPSTKSQTKIIAKVLALHGCEDKQVPQQEVSAFEEEMTQAGVDWQLHTFGNTYHAFAIPGSLNLELGLKYSEEADKRSWQLMQNFLAEVFL